MPQPATSPAILDDRTVARVRTTAQDAHLLFLIGAGTAAGLCKPLGNVERALTEIDATEPPGDARDIARASIQALFFDAVIWPNVALLADAPGTREVVRSYARFGLALNRLLLSRRSSLLDKQCTLVTTNIDLLFEAAFENVGLDLNDGFTGRFLPHLDSGAFGASRFRSSPRYGHKSEMPGFDLLKLHGSVGWRWTESGSIAFDVSLENVHETKAALDEVREELVQLDDPTGVTAAEVLSSARDHERPAGLDAFTDAYERFVIVNPEKSKFATTVMTETYYELIRHLANALERETSLLIVHGFSFRDEHLRKIILRGARSNPTLQVIAMCYSQRDELACRALIPDTELPNSNVDFVAPSNPEGRLSLDELTDSLLVPMLDEPAGIAEAVDAALPTED